MASLRLISGRIALAIGLALGAIVIGSGGQVTAQVPSTDLSTSKDGPSEVLAGEMVEYTVSATNNGSAALFNLTFRDVLPLGVTYAGPTSPAVAGEPQIIVNEVPDTTTGELIGQQTLIWDNVADLQPLDSFSISFGVDLNDVADVLRPDLPVYLVGSTVTNDSAAAYASRDARRKATFDDQGLVVTDPVDPNLIVVDESGPVTTRLTALRVDKRSDSAPEGELLRGVHDNVATYTVRVEVTGQDAVDGITVIDLVPAELEFLADNNTDNSTAEEYPGSGPLGTGPAVAGYIPPDVVETVVDPVLDGTTYPGVYTRIEWDLGDLPSGGSFEFPYAAAIPLRANAAFAGTPPSTGGAQAANLDNNTGAETRELSSERGFTNIAFAGGDYQGAVEVGSPTEVSATDRLSRTIEDVRIRKSATPTQFITDAVIDYSVVIETSEYVDASGIVLTDEIPNGICPLGPPGQNYAPNGDSVCTGEASFSPTVPFDTVTAKPDGGFTVVFEPITTVAANGDLTVTYRGRAREFYEGGPDDGLPTASGDSFTNTVTAAATTTPGPGVPGDPVVGVVDESSATQNSGTITIAKELLARNVTPRLDAASSPVTRCPDPDTNVSNEPGQVYVDPVNIAPADQADSLGFRLGDQICFRLRVDFDQFVQTRDPVIVDFIPAGTEYVAGSVREAADNNVDLNFVDPGAGANSLEFPVGTGPAGQRYTALGSVFDVVFAAEVTEVPSGGAPTITGNLMKMRVETTSGEAQSFRDEVDFGIVPPAPLQVVKGVADVDGVPSPQNAVNSDVDDVEVAQDDDVRFRIDLTNLGTASNFNEFSVRELDVLDVLPDGVGCGDITDITNFGPDPSIGECVAPGGDSASTARPYTNSTGSSVIRWFFEIRDGDDIDDYALFPGDEATSTPPVTRTLAYTMTIPTPTSVSTTFDNDAGVRSYGGFTNLQNLVAPA